MLRRFCRVTNRVKALSQVLRRSYSLPSKGDAVRIVEVGPRDGLQNEVQAIIPPVKIELIKRLRQAGLKSIEVGSFVSPKWVPQMAGTRDVLMAVKKMEDESGRNDPDVHFPVLTPNMRGLEDALDAGATEVAVFGAASELFSKKNINRSVDESLEGFSKICERALEQGVRVRGYVSCVLGCPYEGYIAPEKVARVTEKLFDMGCYEVSLGDTIGVGTAGSTRLLLSLLRQSFDISKIAVHFHDTYGQALANILVALDEDIRVVDSSIAGLGGCPYADGASGNVATEEVVYMLNGFGVQTGLDLDQLVKAGSFIVQQVGGQMRSKVSAALLAKAKRR